MSTPASPRRGRPRDPERVRRVLEAATRQFIEQGYEKSSVDSVAQASGVSKMTVYSYFPTKAALFQACIQARCTGLYDMFLEARLDPARPREGLTRVGTMFLELMRDEDVLAVKRAMYSGNSEHEEARRTYWNEGPRSSVQHLSRYLAAVRDAGALAIERPEQAAEQFLSLLCGTGEARALLKVGAPTAEEDAALVHDSVELFMRGYAPPGIPKLRRATGVPRGGRTRGKREA